MKNYTRLFYGIMVCMLLMVEAASAKVSSISPAGPYCPGDSITVTYTRAVISLTTFNVGLTTLSNPIVPIGTLTLKQTKIDTSVKIALPNVPGTYYLVVSNSSLGVNDSSSAPLTINPKPILTVMGLDTTICSGTATAINLSSSVPSGAVFGWIASVVTGGLITPAPASQSPPSGTSSITQTLNNNSNSSTATVKYRIYTVTPAGCASDTTLDSIVINPKPVLTVTNKAICSDMAANISLSNISTSAKGVNKFSWTSVGANISGASSYTATSPFTGNSITDVLHNSNNSNADSIKYNIVPYNVFSSGGPTCHGDTTPVTVTVNPKPVLLTHGLSDTICSEEVFTNVHASTPGSTYTWSVTSSGVQVVTGIGTTTSPSLLFSQKLHSISTATAGIIRYSITPTSAAGCAGALDSLKLLVRPLGRVTPATLTRTVCSGDSIIQVLGTNTDAGSNFTWSYVVSSGIASVSGPNGGSGLRLTDTFINTSSAPAVIVYTVQDPFAKECITTPAIYTVNVNPRPNASSPSVKDICSGQSVDITLSSTASVSNFNVIYDPLNSTHLTRTIPSGVMNNRIQDILTNSSNTTADTVRYIVTSAVSTCTGSSSVTEVRVHPQPVVRIPSSNQSICSKTPFILPLDASAPGARSFGWTITIMPADVTLAAPASGRSDTIRQTFTNNSPVSSPQTRSVVYSITDTSSKGCVSLPSLDTVFVLPQPKITTPVSSPVCHGSAFTNVYANTGPGTTYAWTIVSQTGVNGFNNDTSFTASAFSQRLYADSSTIAGTITYNITPKSAAGCIGTMDPLTLRVRPIGSVTPASFKRTICSGDSILQMFSTTTGEGTAFKWTPVVLAGSSISGAKPGYGVLLTDTLINNMNSGTAVVVYTVQDTITKECISGTVTDTIIVNAKPAITSLLLAKNICSGESVNIDLSSSTGISTFNVIYNPLNSRYTTRIIPSGVANNRIQDTLNNISTTTADTVRYIITSTSTSGCAGSPSTLDVRINPRPVVVLSSGVQSICSNTPVSISLNASTAGTSSFSWTIGGISDVSFISADTIGSVIQQSITNTSPISAPRPGRLVYTITPVAASGCRGIPRLDTVVVQPLPQDTTRLMRANTKTICSRDPIGLTFTPNIAGAFYKWVAPGNGGKSSYVSGQRSDSGRILLNDTLINSDHVIQGYITYRLTPIITYGPLLTCSGSPKEDTINVNPTPTLRTTDTTICSASPLSIDLTARASTGAGSTFIWSSRVSSGLITNNTLSGSDSVIQQTLNNGDHTSAGFAYYAIRTSKSFDNVTCPSASYDTIRVRVNPQPVVLLASGVQSICSNTPVIIHLNASTPGISSFSWTIGNTSDVSFSPGPNMDTVIQQIITNTSPTAAPRTGMLVYTITPFASTGCRGISRLDTVFVRPLPQDTTLLTPRTICSGRNINLTFQPNINGTVYKWDPDIVISNILGSHSDSGKITLNDTLYNPNDAIQKSINYTIKPYISFGSLVCSGPSRSVTIRVNPTPTLRTTDTFICSGAPLTIDLIARASTGTGSTFLWTSGVYSSMITNRNITSGSDSVIRQTLDNADSANARFAYYAIRTSKAFDGVSCPSANYDTIKVRVNPAPKLLSTRDTNICSDVIFIYTPKSSTGIGTKFSYARTSDIDTAILPRTLPTALGENISINERLSSGYRQQDLILHQVFYDFTLESAQGCRSEGQILTVHIAPRPDAPGLPSKDLVAGLHIGKLCKGVNMLNFQTEGRPPFSIEYFKWHAAPGVEVLQKTDSTHSDHALITFRLANTNSDSAIVKVTAFVRGFGCESKESISKYKVEDDNMPPVAVKWFTDSKKILYAKTVGSAVRFQWGYDTKDGLVGNIILGETDRTWSVYDPKASHTFNEAENYYWVMVTFEDSCMQKAYYNQPSALSVPQQPGKSVISIAIYPNPVQNELTIALNGQGLGIINYEVFDLSGRLLSSITSPSGKVQVPVSDLSPGYYMVRCTQNGISLATGRFIKQ